MRRLIATLCTVALIAWPAPAQAPAGAPSAAQVQQRVETYLRKLYAWGPSFTIQVSAPKDAPASGFYEVAVTVIAGGQSDIGTVYVSKDGRFLLRGEIDDMNLDPFAANARKIRVDGRPSAGPADAKVVVVDYSDFQCPHCRELNTNLRALKTRFPQVRFVSKNFPLEQIHPWAMTAATAGVCAYRLKPEAYWQVHHAIFDDQENITPGNAWQKVRQFASAAGIDLDAFTGCLASPEARAAVDADLKEGLELNIANTPTVFVNGRRIVGGEPRQLEQFINYELSVSGRPPQPR